MQRRGGTLVLATNTFDDDASIATLGLAAKVRCGIIYANRGGPNPAGPGAGAVAVDDVVVCGP